MASKANPMKSQKGYSHNGSGKGDLDIWCFLGEALWQEEESGEEKEIMQLSLWFQTPFLSTLNSMIEFSIKLLQWVLVGAPLKHVCMF